MATLHFTDESGAQRSVYCGIDKNEILVGRSGDIGTGNKTVSRLHAKITYENGVFRVKDLDSANGTWVNKKRIREHVLSHEDQIVFGSFEVVFRLDPMDIGEQANANENGSSVTQTDSYLEALTLPSAFEEKPSLSSLLEEDLSMEQLSLADDSENYGSSSEESIKLFDTLEAWLDEAAGSLASLEGQLGAAKKSGKPLDLDAAFAISKQTSKGLKDISALVVVARRILG